MRKQLLTTSLLLFSILSFGQGLKLVNQKLTQAFGKINYWTFYKVDNNKIDSYDSLEKANDTFEKLLLRYTSTNPQTLTSNFKNLVDSGLIVVTSEDNLFRIYTWDTQTGGTMHEFRNVYQYKNAGKVFSKVIKSKNTNEDGGDPGCSYYKLNDIISNNKKYYIAQSTFILSSGLFYQNLKIFSIDNFKLNDTAKLIKTKPGLKNELGYEVDLTTAANRDREVPDYSISYDKSKKIITIPLILEDGKVTEKKIMYKFNGQYFEKL